MNRRWKLSKKSRLRNRKRRRQVRLEGGRGTPKRRAKGTSRHHQLPSSRGGTANPSNIVMKLDKEHRAWHILFFNWTPIEILIHIMKQWFGIKITEEMTKVFLEIDKEVHRKA